MALERDVLGEMLLSLIEPRVDRGGRGSFGPMATSSAALTKLASLGWRLWRSLPRRWASRGHLPAMTGRR